MQSQYRRSRSEMFPLIEKWLSSGLSRSAFCAQEGLSIGTFAYWRAKYLSATQESSAPSTTDFVPIAIASTESAPIMEVNLSSVSMKFYQLPPVSYLQELFSL